MLKLYLILSALSFMASSLFFFWALVCKYNEKRMLEKQGEASHDDTFDFKELNRIDQGIARNYRIAVNLWIICTIFFLGFALAAVLSR